MLVIDRMLFTMAFGRDVDFHDMYPQTTYLDRRTGDVVWLYEDDYRNRGALWYLSVMDRARTRIEFPRIGLRCRCGSGGAPRLRGLALAGGSEGNARLVAAVVAVAVCMSMLSGASSAGDFYLRGGIGLDWPADNVFTDRDCSSTAPAALYGCGTGGDGAPYRSRGGFGTVPTLELGLGYAGAASFEVLVEYRPRFAFEGRANFLAPERRQLVTADLSSVSGMLAAYVDLARLGLPKLGPFAPFVGPAWAPSAPGSGRRK